MIPGSYIVRIYRRGKDDPRVVVGVVEEVGVEGKRGFSSLEELRAILNIPRGRPPRRWNGGDREDGGSRDRVGDNRDGGNGDRAG